MKADSMPHVVVLYHYMHPDDVVSALHMDGLAQDLASMGWCVEAMPCNRGCRNEGLVYNSFERFKGVDYRRVWRPRFRQASTLGRLLNSAWMVLSWMRLVFRSRNSRPDVVIIGTDPIFSVIAAIFIRFFQPNIIIAHWCFDLHPEAAVAEGRFSGDAAIVRFVKFLMRKAYRSCDLIVDLGPCMRKRIKEYGHRAQVCELTPWALVEPDAISEVDLTVRRQMFGSAKLGLLYSGNFGEAHEYETFLALARSLRHNSDIHFCFAVRGNRADAIKNSVNDDDRNVSFIGFASVAELEKRLASADIHLVSLKDNWAGVAVPSKFFGSLAIGRPVLYAGPKESAISSWVREHEIGWAIEQDDVQGVAMDLNMLSLKPDALQEKRIRCFNVYREFFSRRHVTSGWDRHLRRLISERLL